MENAVPDIRREFDFLKQVGYRESGSEYVPESFGNAFVEYRSDTLRLRVIRDRGQFELALGSADHSKLFDADIVFRLIGADEQSRPVVSDTNATPETLAKALRRNLALLEAAFRREQYASTVRELDRLLDVRLKERYGDSASEPRA